MMRRLAVLGVCLVSLAGPAHAQENQREEAARRAAALARLPENAAKRAFFAVDGPAPLAARAIGAYGRGCLAGAVALAPEGSNWQAMRLSRGRNWGHPALINWIERFAADARADGWPGLLVGDIAQARGGPMLTGHASHQMGLEADLWLTPSPGPLSRGQREEISATDMVQPDRLSVYPDRFTDAHVRLLRRAASSPQVDRIFVNAAIKKALCERAPPGDRSWLGKIRPWWGHTFHFHVALDCPPDSAGTCANRRAPVPRGDGCSELAYWFQPGIRFPRPREGPPAPEVTLAQMPEACRRVLVAR
jgi:penicillin-insensitive murein endopeptidase